MEHLKTCPLCGKEFISEKPPQKYCSRECSHQAEKNRRDIRRLMQKKPKAAPVVTTPKRDPHEFINKVNEHIRANGGVYAPRKGWGY